MILKAQKIYVGYAGAKMPFQNFLKTVITSWITVEPDPQLEHIVLDETVSWLTGHHFRFSPNQMPRMSDQAKSVGSVTKRTSKLIILQHLKQDTSVSQAYCSLLCTQTSVSNCTIPSRTLKWIAESLWTIIQSMSMQVACFIMLFSLF